jgi:hypothetical protein
MLSPSKLEPPDGYVKSFQIGWVNIWSYQENIGPIRGQNWGKPS